ncbi:MAG: hypothetical protein KC502_15950 [Myxococcales bacterium]|nr:hypothetical protein [Myxococcales bacterium]
MAALAAMGRVSVLLLESINDIEHDGLLRNLKPMTDASAAPDGSAAKLRRRYERVKPHHWWNSSHRIRDVMVVNLARHSDHQALASRPLERLRHLPDTPQMPSRFGAIFLLSFVLPLRFTS